jgi:hypothetical protein
VVFTVGVTVTIAVVAPVLQAYEPPPVAVSTLLWPTQIVDGLAPAAAIGKELTVTVVVVVAVQPVDEFVTVTVYVVVVAGLTVTEAAVAPVLQA